MQDQAHSTLPDVFRRSSAASNSGIIVVVGQKITLGIHARQIVTVHVAAEVITIDLGEDTWTVWRAMNWWRPTNGHIA
jgi:hypothetical protein